MPDLIPEFTNRYQNMLPEKNDIKEISNFKKYFDAKNIFEQKGLLYSIFGILVESTNFKEAANNEESQLLIKILRYIEKNFKTPCLLQTAAEELSYGYSYLSRTFKKRMGISYTEYLNKYRITEHCICSAIKIMCRYSRLRRSAAMTAYAASTAILSILLVVHRVR